MTTQALADLSRSVFALALMVALGLLVGFSFQAVRALVRGEPTHHWVWQSLAWSAGILAVFFTIAVHLYRNVTA